MKHGVCVAAWVERRVERAACATPFRGKMGKGRIPTEAFASLLANPGEPIFRQPGVAGAVGLISAISRRCDQYTSTSPCRMHMEVESPAARNARVSAKDRMRTGVGNSCTAVQHLTKALLLSKRAEPPLSPRSVRPASARRWRRTAPLRAVHRSRRCSVRYRLRSRID